MTPKKPASVKDEVKLTMAHIGKATYYHAKGDTDTTEGRGPLRTIGYFLWENNARRAVKGQGVFGNDGYVETITSEVVYYTDETGRQVCRKLGPEIRNEFEDEDEVKAKALAKLSAKERKALGL